MERQGLLDLDLYLRQGLSWGVESAWIYDWDWEELREFGSGLGS